MPSIVIEEDDGFGTSGEESSNGFIGIVKGSDVSHTTITAYTYINIDHFMHFIGHHDEINKRADIVFNNGQYEFFLFVFVTESRNNVS